MNRLSRLAVLLSLSVLASCGPDASSPTSLEPSLSRSGEAGPSVSGHVNFLINGQLQTTSFHARVLGNGRVDGVLQANSRVEVFGGRLHGRVECFAVEGNDAWLAGRIERSDIPNYEAVAFWIHVRDNGEGANSPPDQWTDVAVWSADDRVPSRLCERRFRLAMRPIESGNVQVRP